MKLNIYQYLLVIIQFCCIGVIMYTNPLPNLFISKVLSIISIIIIISSIYSMRTSKLRILPEPNKNASLIETGIYNYIRHPMYSSIILYTGSISFEKLEIINFMAFLSLIIILLLKIDLEEKLLSIKFNNYKNYKKKTYKILPFIY